MAVAASVLGAVRWMLARPHEGVRLPDELPWELVLDAARPYLGTQWSGPLDWDPLTTRVGLFDRYDQTQRDTEDPWQFTNFLVS